MNAHPTRKRTRRGGILIDVIISATLLLALVSTLATMTFRAGRVWQRLRQEQLALDELSNHLDQLTALPTNDRAEAMKEITVSPVARDALRDAMITAATASDDFSDQITVTLTWQGPAAKRRVELVGWAFNSATDEAE